MAQDHFKTPPGPKKGHGMTKNHEKSKKSSRVGQEEVAALYLRLKVHSGLIDINAELSFWPHRGMSNTELQYLRT